MEITVVKVERIEATLRHMSEYELARARTRLWEGAAGSDEWGVLSGRQHRRTRRRHPRIAELATGADIVICAIDSPQDIHLPSTTSVARSGSLLSQVV